jgi:deoxyribodipyrimidine photolyase-related protein
MSAFLEALRRIAPPAAPAASRRQVYVPYDQLSDRIGPLAREAPASLGIVLVESPWKAAQRPYHKQKLALVLANQRHFALEQAARGVAVTYLVHDGPYGEALAGFVRKHGPVRMMQAAERELRADLAPLVADERIEVLPHEGWLTRTDDFAAAHRAGPPWLMDTFYRHVRRELGILVDAKGKPAGGKWSHDAENRKPWRGTPPAPEPPTFTPDAVTREVGAIVERHFARHPGTLDLAHLPATRADAERMLAWAAAECLVEFGPYEDAMSTRSSGLFHTRLSPLVNLHRLLPREAIDAALAADLPIASREGFVRQILGWREFMRHVHEATDGFRKPVRPARSAMPVCPTPGDGGYARWAGESWAAPTQAADGGSDVSVLGARRPVPPAYWGRPSGFACLDHVVGDVWREAYSHHITRLMVLSNVATLADVSPRELADWFWVAYQDAYDWVVEPNVMGMGTFGLGRLFTTKPYISGAAYIDRMSDYCGDCAFDPKRTCPFTRMYWAFLERNRAHLADNQRLAMPMRNVARRPEEEKAEDARVFERVSALLTAGERVTPAALE